MYEREQNIIGCLLQGIGSFVFEVLDESDFVFEQMRKVFIELRNLNAKQNPVDFQKVSKSSGLSVQTLAEIMTSSITQSLEGCVEGIKKDSAKRKYELVMAEPRVGEIDDIIDDVVTELQSINLYKTNKSKDMDSVILGFVDMLTERKVNSGKEIKSGLAKLDRALGGFHKKEFTIIGARPSVGKSAFGLQIACHAAKDRKVLFVSLEMADIQIMERITARFSDVAHWRLRTGMIGEKEWSEIHKALDLTSKFNLHIDTSIRTVAQLRTKILSSRPEIVIVDYIGLLQDTSKKFKDKREEMSSITHKLKSMALDYDIPIIALAQLGRDYQERKPNLSSLRDSGSLEEDADNVIFIHRLTDKETEYIATNDEFRLPVLIMIEKQRNGECCWIKSVYQGNKFQFMEME